MEPPAYKDGADPAALEKKIASGDEANVSGDELRDDLVSVQSGEDILGRQDMDPVMNMKMHLVNNVGGPSLLQSICRTCRTGPFLCPFPTRAKPVATTAKKKKKKKNY